VELELEEALIGLVKLGDDKILCFFVMLLVVSHNRLGQEGGGEEEAMMGASLRFAELFGVLMAFWLAVVVVLVAAWVFANGEVKEGK